jgi:hypothetical protein
MCRSVKYMWMELCSCTCCILNCLSGGSDCYSYYSVWFLVKPRLEKCITLNQLRINSWNIFPQFFLFSERFIQIYTAANRSIIRKWFDRHVRLYDASILYGYVIGAYNVSLYKRAGSSCCSDGTGDTLARSPTWSITPSFLMVLEGHF